MSVICGLLGADGSFKNLYMLNMVPDVVCFVSKAQYNLSLSGLYKDALCNMSDLITVIPIVQRQMSNLVIFEASVVSLVIIQ